MGIAVGLEKLLLSFVDQFQEMGRAVFYDYLYEQHNFDVFQLDSLYRKNLEKDRYEWIVRHPVAGDRGGRFLGNRR